MKSINSKVYLIAYPDVFGHNARIFRSFLCMSNLCSSSDKMLQAEIKENTVELAVPINGLPHSHKETVSEKDKVVQNVSVLIIRPFCQASLSNNSWLPWDTERTKLARLTISAREMKRALQIICRS